MIDDRFAISKHAGIRARQRGYRQADISFVIENGTQVPDGYFLREKDAASIIRRARLMISNWKYTLEQASRLRGTFVPLVSEAGAVSIYRPCRRKLKHLLHDRRRAGRRNKRRAHQ